MHQLMIGLDKKILDKESAVAQRMIEYGKKDELFIIIPDKEKVKIDLSITVKVETSSGLSKKAQFFRMKRLGLKLIKENQIIKITTQDPFFTGLIGVWLKRKTGIKLEVQMHGDFFGDYYKKQLLKLCLAKFVLKRADIIRVVGEQIKQSLIKLGLDESKIEIRPILVDVEKIKNYQPKINLHQKYPVYEKIFLVLGRLEPVKNILWLIDVFREVVKQRNYLLLIVGSGSENNTLELLVTNYKLQNNIKFESWTNDPFSYLKTADCILFPSLSEGYGLVATEAVAANASIIMNDVGAANYELKPSDKVKILPVNDKEKWIQNILLMGLIITNLKI